MSVSKKKLSATRGPASAVRRVDAVAVVALVAACVGIVMLGSAPVAESKRHVAELGVQLNAAKAENGALLDKASLLTERIALLRRALDENAVPLKPTGSVNAQIARITELANESSLTLGEIAPGKETKLPTHIERPVALSGAGAFADLVSFFERLESRFPDLRVRSFGLNRDRERPGTTMFNVELTWYSVSNAG